MIQNPDSVLATRVLPSPNFGARKDAKLITCVILHYTGMTSADAALAWLCNPDSQVSCHYLIYEDGQVVQMVREVDRAWHAGRGIWHGETDLNSVSIGIEIANRGHEASDPAKPCPEFPKPQIDSVIALARDIATRHHMAPDRILAHSDIAPRRKIDPGERFPWMQLAEHGLGVWVQPAAIQGGRFFTKGDHGKPIAAFQAMLALLGFGVPQGGHFDEETEFVVKAFQRHYRPERIDGVADVSTIETLRDLLKAR